MKATVFTVLNKLADVLPELVIGAAVDVVVRGADSFIGRTFGIADRFGQHGNPDATDSEITLAADLAEASEFIEELPQGYDTVVGERGQKLSGGQRQRLSIARAILREPAVLVLDEATSSVDNETEAAIQHSLDIVGKDRTVIVIAHRLSTVRNADRIHVMANGRITETGTHSELVARDGIYAALWRVQTGER